ncbi:BAG family molecular chaperone regulator like [Actinidia chinensis var. chinensis]|uniref:BAG family molecular chaperone regulator like n=1 Tax=Actinidia chinensis var. chinensis TaxID=1590841 RepID=A0A2R6PM61_ACTCC|nr:BAG family molecular chaperone regulator like [Actinidia chinensis var. chinensis]
MSRFRRIEIIEPSPSLFVRETSIFAPKTLALPHCFPSFAFEDEFDFAFDLLHPTPTPALIDFTSPFHEIDAVTDLIRIEKTPVHTSTRRVQRRVERFGTELYLQSLCDRVSALELSFDRLVNAKPHEDRKYTWTAEIKGPEKCGIDRKYVWKAEINGGKKKEKGDLEKNYKWTAEIKDKDAPVSRKYTFKKTTGDAVKTEKCSGSEKKEKCGTGVVPTRVVEIEEPPNHRADILRQAFVKRANCKGKRKELSPQDAAMMIQVNFRAYLIRRSQALRALRELAVAKAKLKEIRALFNNFTYRRRMSRDGEERQRFSEKIIVLLLTVDAIEGADIMVRSAKRSMVDELEAMLDVIDPQPAGRSLSMRRRTFDMPDGVIQKELAAGVAEVVQMLDQENGTFEAL